jgi:hypothetical protein
MKKGGCLTASLIVILLMSAAMPYNSCALGTIKGTVIGSNPVEVSNVSKGVPLSNPGTNGDILQFKANNHILGFQSTKAYLASLNHALSVEFLGTPGVMPTSAEPASTAGIPGGAPAMGKVVYQNLWPGISLTYEATKTGIAESTYHVAPGADVSRIRLRYNVPVETREDGTLRFRFDSGYLTESSPVAWQEIDGKQMPVRVAYRVSGKEVGFSLGKYDSRHPLIIDPTYAWHTFHGGGNRDVAYGIAVDSIGNVYVTGYSVSNNWGGALHAFSGGSDIFVLKLDSSGAYQWHTFYGSSTDDTGYSIAVDGSGSVYVTGESGSTWGSPLNAHSGNGDIFVLKLDNNGAYQWHTFYGSSSGNTGNSITVDTSGNVYVTGHSWATWGSPLHSYTGNWDMFVLKLSSSGAYQWHTFYGSGAHEYGYGIATDSSGNVYVAGVSYGAWNGPTGQSPLNTYIGSGGSGDIFVLKLDTDGAYKWHTFYGSSNQDQASGISVDGSGNVYITGLSYATWGSPLNAKSGNNDIFVLKLNSSGSYQWHTFYGSSNPDYADGIAVDGSGNVYVTGRSNATWGSPRNAYSGNYDIFVLKLNSNGAYVWNTFYGAVDGDDNGRGIAVDVSGNVYVTGDSLRTWGSPINSFNYNNEIFVLKMMMAYDTNRESLYAIIQNCLPSSSDAVCNPGSPYEGINEDTVFRTPMKHTIINSEVIISPWYDGDWQNQITNSTDTGFNTVHKGTPSDKFEVISYVDEYSPICGTRNQQSYFFTYTTRNTSAGYAVTIDRWIDYLKAIKLDYGRPIDTLTIFSHASAGDVAMSEAFHLTEQTAPLFSRLKNENILAPNASILLFACEAGKGETGESFAQALANATCATVYANKEYTGNYKLNYSDWDLDVVKQPNNCSLYGDVAPLDGDVDGSDLAVWIAAGAPTGMDVPAFAASFGRTTGQ